MKFLLPSILIIAALGLFFVYTNPAYLEAKELKVRADSYGEALNNSKKLQTVRDALVTKYNSFSPELLDRLKKLLPDNVDNIKLVLEIDRIASQYGMQIKNIKYDTLKAEVAPTGRGGVAAVAGPKRDYNDFALEFSIEGSYPNFINFLESLEKSLRAVDPESIAFTVTDQVSKPGALPSDIYKFDLKVKTYWLKS